MTDDYRRTKYVWHGYGERHQYLTLGAARRARNAWSRRTRCGTSITRLDYVEGVGWIGTELSV